MISPHLDDAVFACGHLLAGRPGAVVATVCAGRPPAASPLTEWDAASGFAPGDDVIGARRAEDRAALARLGARPVWLPFRDDQYGDPAPLAAIAEALERVVAALRPRLTLFPLGLFHRDHRRVSDAALLLRARARRGTWAAYEDSIYRRVPGLLAARLAELRARGLAPSPLPLGGGAGGAGARCRRCVLKGRAVACYRSQLRALATPGRPGHADVLAGERYWRLG